MKNQEIVKSPIFQRGLFKMLGVISLGFLVMYSVANATTFGGSGTDQSATFQHDFMSNPDANGSNITGFHVFNGGGNLGITVGNDCSNCSGTTQFYKNSNGTYNTITTYTQNSNNNGGGGGGGTVRCPPGTTLKLTTTGSGKGARTVRSCVTPPSSCPTGQVLENGHCVTPPPTCPRGQQTQNGHCVTTPTCQGGQVAQNGRCVTITHRSCTLDGRTIVDGGHWTFFSHRTVAAGQLCSSFDQIRTCTDGSLSGSASYRYQSCSVDQAQNTATAPIISITATPSIVRLGGSSRIVWDGGLATSCSVSGPGLSSTSIRGSKIISNIQEQSVYLLSCATGAAAAEDSATVDIVPIWREY